MKKCLAAIASIMLITGSYAEESAEQSVEQAQFFFKNYLTVCAKNVTNFDSLRVKLKNLPKLPAHKAKHFDLGSDADAFPIPTAKENLGHFVVSVAKDKNVCGVFGRRGDAEVARKSFIRFFQAAPKPLLSKLQQDTVEQVQDYEVKHIAYVWGVEGAERKMLFMLSTSNSNKAPMQLLATAAIMKE